MKSFVRKLVVLLTVPLLAVSCSSGVCEDSAATTEPATTEASTTTASSTTLDEATTDAPSTSEENVAEVSPAEDALNFVVSMLNELPTTDAVEERFAPSFLSQVSAEEVIGLLPQVTSGATGPWEVTTSDLGELQGAADVRAPGATGIAVQLRVEASEPHLIEGLFFQPIIDAPNVSGISEVDTAMADFASGGGLGIYELVDGSCVALHENNTAEPLPQGSVFKLWILAELAHQIDAGEAAWDEMLAVEDRYKSSPDGEIFALAEGTERSLEEFAGLMISISDNSATDHLLHRLGRDRVEARMAELTADADLNVPFLSATDLFILKFDPAAPNSDDYRSADLDGKRDLLQAIEEDVVPWIGGVDDFPLTNADGLEFQTPRDHDLEWFATPGDICATHAELAALAATPGLEPVASVLSINPNAGMTFDPAVWADLRYKGGSEPGIVAVSWWMERVDGRQFVLAGSLVDEDNGFDSIAGVALLHSAVALIDQIG